MTTDNNVQMDAKHSGSPDGLGTTPLATAFWSRHLRSYMGPLLEKCGSYTPEEQASHLDFMDKHIAPCLGPMPSEPHGPYTAPSSLYGSPIDASLNFTSTGKPKLRFDFDFLTPIHRMGPDPFGEKTARELLRRVAATVGANTQWMEHLMDKFWLSPAETEVALSKIPAEMAIPPAMIGIEMDGPKISMKAYIPAMRKAIATGRSSTDIILEAVRAMDPFGPEFEYGLDILEDYIANSGATKTLVLAGVDCVDPTVNKDARIKCYMHTVDTTFGVAKDMMTLGGRLNDEISLQRVETLRQMWPLLLNEPDGSSISDTWSKPERFSGTGYAGRVYTAEIRPGNQLPMTKVYVPVFQYADSSDVTEKNYEGVLKIIDNSWGHTQKYSEFMQSVFGRGAYGQTYFTYSSSEKKGSYTTTYFAKPINNQGVGGEKEMDQFVYV
ncbi:aromatic prenyltransferase [Bombardia bombarda]|uniref:Aromatic prenyltransferase n=1 Tax=Bombardia bombarda TaxID=252184 RepID=A0AA39WGJ7_9PEZI|nr:aromatic prenyltransferase [Bombardia bombarda]